jgi:hypothetical protein
MYTLYYYIVTSYNLRNKIVLTNHCVYIWQLYVLICKIHEFSFLILQFTKLFVYLHIRIFIYYCYFSFTNNRSRLYGYYFTTKNVY